MIIKRTKQVTDVKLGNLSIAKVFKGKVLVFSKVPDTGEIIPPKNPSQLMLDQTQSNSTAMVTGQLGKDGNPKTNVVSWIRANSHRFVGTYNSNLGMVLSQLDDTLSTKYLSGVDASADLTSKDVFMKMPTFWFRGEKVAENKYNIYFTVVEPTSGTWIKWDGNTLIGVYKAVCENTGNNTTGGLFSRSGVTPTVNVSQANFKAKARNRSNGDDHFMIVTYEAHYVMALLYACYYGNTNGQAVIGAGTSSYPKVTGQTNVDGMQDTVNENSRSINFWGLENWWGDIYEWIDNLMSAAGSSGNGICTILDYNGTEVRRVSGCATSGNEIKEMILGESLDLLPKTTVSNSSYNTYYCDYGCVDSSSGYVGRRSNYGSDTIGGPFYLSVSISASYAYTSFGSRLLYHGRVVIDSPELLTIHSVELGPVPAGTMSKARAISGMRALLTIKGQNLNKLEDLIPGLPEGIEISELSEGTTERTAVVTYTDEALLENLTLQLGGYEVQLVDPVSEAVDLQTVIYEDKEVLRTGMDFHICNVIDNSLLSDIYLKGNNLQQANLKVLGNSPNVESSINEDLGISIKTVGTIDELSLDIFSNENKIGTILVHKNSEEEVLAELAVAQEPLDAE